MKNKFVNAVEHDRRSLQSRIRDELLRCRPPSDGLPPDVLKSVESLDQAQQAHARGYAQGLLDGISIGNAMLARGTRDIVKPDEESTAPYPVVDPDLIDKELP